MNPGGRTNLSGGILPMNDHNYLFSKDAGEMAQATKSSRCGGPHAPKPIRKKAANPDSAEIKLISANTLSKWYQLRDMGGFADNETFCFFLLQNEEARQSTELEAHDEELEYLSGGHPDGRTTQFLSGEVADVIEAACDNRAWQPVPDGSIINEVAPTSVIPAIYSDPNSKHIEMDAQNPQPEMQSDSYIVEGRPASNIQSCNDGSQNPGMYEIFPVELVENKDGTYSIQEKKRLARQARRKGRGRAREWIEIKTLSSMAVSEAYVRSLKTWTSEKPWWETKSGMIQTYRCNLAGRMSCPARLKTYKYNDSDEVILSRASCDHDHSGHKLYGIAEPVRDEIDRLFSGRVTQPLAILRSLTRSGFKAPTIKQIGNYLWRMKKRANPPTQFCNECHTAYRSKKKLDEHFQKYHNPANPCPPMHRRRNRPLTDDGRERPFACDECGKGFQTKAGLKAHLRGSEHLAIDPQTEIQQQQQNATFLIV